MLQNLSEATLSELEDAESNYNFGWSRGREALEDGRPDVNKGSFYAGPLQDIRTTDQHLLSTYPGFCRQGLLPHATCWKKIGLPHEH